MIVLIPARGGSKGIKNKNTRVINGKPLIVWTIKTALSSSYIDEVIVSTDCHEIADIAISAGAKVPFFRPEDLSGDSAKAIDAYIYTIDRLKREYGYVIEDFAVLLPTSPLRSVDDINGAIRLFYEKKADSVMTYSRMSHPPEWAVKINSSMKISPYFSEIANNRNRQEFSQAYICNGSIYVFKLSLLKDHYTYFSNNTFSYIMPQERSIDIDTEIDFKFAEFLMSENEKPK